jgi:hypothetical protein
MHQQPRRLGDNDQGIVLIEDRKRCGHETTAAEKGRPLSPLGVGMSSAGRILRGCQARCSTACRPQQSALRRRRQGIPDARSRHHAER